MTTKYHIVPKNNGYYMLGKENYFTLVPKHRGDGSELVFDTEAEAQRYIDRFVLTSMCKPEKFLTEFICPKCGSALRTQYVEGADRSYSGYTERICSCRNEECLADWEIFTDEYNNIIETKRYFFG